MMTALGSDLRSAWRMVWRQPGPNAAIVATLALGIAATTSVFAVFNHVLFRPTPGVYQPDQLVSIAFQPEDEPQSWASGSREAERIFQSASLGLSAVAVWSGSGTDVPAILHSDDAPRLLSRELVAAGYFETLGVKPRLGRLFTVDETRQPGSGVALISELLWQREYGAASNVLGQPLTINGTPYAIVGVVDDYRGLSTHSSSTVDVWLPEAEDRVSPVVSLLIGRVARRDTLAQLPTLQAALREAYAPVRGTLTGPAAAFVPWVYPGLRLGPRARGLGLPPFALVLVVPALLLALACANAANLLLAMTTRRRQDLALRAAIGASRWRLARTLCFESMALVAAAVGGGLLLTRLAVSLLEGSQLFATGATLTSVSLDWRVVLFATATGALTVLTFAMLPILSASRVDLRAVLQESTRSDTGPKRLSRALVAVQLALSLPLTAGAAVLINSSSHLRHADLGMEADQIYSFEFNPRLAGQSGANGRSLLARALTALRDTSGVRGVGTANPSVFDPRFVGGPLARLDSEAPEPAVTVRSTVVSPDYFDAVGVPILTGRALVAADLGIVGDVPRPVVISSALARALFGEQPPVGQRIAVGRSFGEWTRHRTGEVVGVAGDTEIAETIAGAEAAFMLYEAVEPTLVATRVYVRSDLPAADVAQRVRQVLWDVDPRLLPIGPGSLRDEVGRNFPEERSLTWLVGIVALVATLLGCAGVHAVTAHGVSQRTREFGVRIALGATPAEVVGQAARGLAWPTAVGTLVGIAVYMVASRLIASRLVGVSALDPATLGVVVVLLASALGMAIWLPARHAASVDPVTVLRAD